MSEPEPTVRQARHADEAAVVSFTSDTWGDRETSDYIPAVFHQWVETDGPDQRTFVAEVDESVVGVTQVVLLSDDEAWSQGLRVAADARDSDVGSALSQTGLRWARERGATVSRGMVFSWNVMGLGHARANGFEPTTEFRWAHPEPDENATVDPQYERRDAPDEAWRFWTESDARTHLSGLALAPSQSWALRELTRTDLRQAADEDALVVVRRAGTCGVAYRHSVREVTTKGETAQMAEYGVAAWTEREAWEALGDAIARDAAAQGADETRVLIPETARHVSDVAVARTAVAESPDFVVSADLTDETRFG